jgi:DNA-directed RNA polymerase subunit RPC12/RpoP
LKEEIMATYECSECGMGINATCAKCEAPLVDDSMRLDDGTEVQISKCPNNHGKIKSPMCCGEDMACTLE